MSTKPTCDCWKDPERRIDKELRVDGIGRAIQISVDQAVRDLSICVEAVPYVAGSVIAGLVFWVAYMRRGDGRDPTSEQIAVAERDVIQLSRERLEGAHKIHADHTGSVH